MNWLRKVTMTLDEKASTVFTYVSQPLSYFFRATTEQQTAIYQAYTYLWASTPSEYQAQNIYDSLVVIALLADKPAPVAWLLTELRFEAFAAAMGDRKRAALIALEHSLELVNDEALDLYNERVDRAL